MHDSILEQTLWIVDSFLVRVLRNSRDWITVIFNPQWARATPLGEVTRRGEKLSFPLSTYRRNCNKLNSVFGNAREYVRWLAKVERGGKRVGAIYNWRTCVRDGGWKFMPANHSRHPTKLITAHGSRAHDHEGGCPCFAGVSGVCHIYRHFVLAFLFSPRFAETCLAETRPRSKVAIDSRTGRVSPVSFCTSIDSSESFVKYLDNEGGRAFFEVPVEGSRSRNEDEKPRTCEISKLKISIAMAEMWYSVIQSIVRVLRR